MKIPVLLGTVRRDRQGIRAARWVLHELGKRGHEGVLVDPAELHLPLLDRMYKEQGGDAPENLKQLAELYRTADGFVVVSGEYNHSIPPAMTNLLDYFLEEYFWRPSAIVSYSITPFGGMRAAMQLRALLAEIGMPSIPSIQAVAEINKSLSEDGRALTQQLAEKAGRFFDEFEWYMRAFRAERAKGVPY